MNKYLIKLCVFDVNGNLFRDSQHFIDSSCPTTAQIELIESQCGHDVDVSIDPIVGGIQCEARLPNGYIVRTFDTKLVQLVDAY